MTVDILKQLLFWEYQQGPIHIIGWHLYYLIVMFLVLAWVLSRFLFRPVLALVEEREEKVRQSERAERESLRQFQEKNEAYQRGLQEARREAYTIREEAQREASKEGDRDLERVRDDTQRRIGEALESLEARMAESREALKKDAGEMARSIAMKILGREEAGS